ncbi:MAG: terminase [Muribaculaceae bacterium]|nr:terminase [Muribaculaceae bacterium]
MNPIERILAENIRRNEKINEPFDPVSGVGSVGPRFEFCVKGFNNGNPLFLPLSMKDEPLVSTLLSAGSLNKAAGFSDARAVELEERFTRLRALHDFPFWAASFVRIKCKGGGEDILFRLNRPQRRFVEALERERLADRPIRLILLKARQWGGSTCSQLYMSWLQLIHSNGLNSLIIAHQGSGSDEIKDMFDRMIYEYPVSMLHDYGDSFDEKEKKLEGVGKSRSIFRVPQRNCKIKIGTAERPDSCRGGDYNLVHLSEVGIWKATDGKCPEDIVRSACSGILFKPMTMIVMESTANGTGNFFHREYLAASRGESQFKPLFISWFDIEQYSLPPENPGEFAEYLWLHRESTEQTSRSQSGSYLWNLWERGATLEAINWYVAERSKFSDHGAMASEYPSDEIEAFAHSGMRVFDPYAVERLRAGCCEPVARGIVVTDDDFSIGGLRRLSVKNPRFIEDCSEFLDIWEFPDISDSDDEIVENRYLVVMDIGGRNRKADWTVITVFDRLLMLENEGPAVVAQWRGHADLDIVAAYAARIASFYGFALLVIESNSIESRDADRFSEMDHLPFVMSCLKNVYPNLYTRSGPQTDIIEGKPLKYGFHTNTATKPMVIASLVKCIREHLYVERDEKALAEFLQYEQRRNGSYGAIAGCHDDILMTRAIGLHICYNEMPLPAIRHKTEAQYPHHSRNSPSSPSESTFF